MKRHLLTLLFFFLLLDSSLSISLEPTIGKGVGEVISTVKNKVIEPLFSSEDGKKVRNDALDKAKDHLLTHMQDRVDSQPQPGASPKKINHGLAHQTRQQHSLFRCGVKDVRFFYPLSPTNRESWPKGRNWFSNRTNLTYRFDPNIIGDTFAQVFRDSFRRWSQELSLTLTEKRYDEYDYADITIKFYDNFKNNMVVGESLIKLIPSKSGDAAVGYILLDANKNWGILNDSRELNRAIATPVDNGMIDMGTVAMHQIGHLLGLSHSSHIDSVMYRYISPGKQRKLFSIDDKQQIKQVYSPNGNGVGSSP